MATRDMVPIRSFLEALGVPSSAIQYDQQSGSVRVGDHTIQPETNLEGRTYAQPDVLRQAVQNLQGLLPQQSTGPAPSGGPITPPMNDQFALPDFGAATQNTLDILQQTTPQFEAIRQQMAPTSDQVARAVDIMGQTASGAPTLNAQTQVANMFNQLGQTLGLMPGQVPEMAGMFSDLLGQTTGQQTEQRRANMAQEAVARAAQALAERQFAWQQAVYADELARADAERAAGEFSLPDQIQYALAAANAFLEANPDASFEDAAGIITGLMGEAITPQAAEQAIMSLRNRRFPEAPPQQGVMSGLFRTGPLSRSTITQGLQDMGTAPTRGIGVGLGVDAQNPFGLSAAARSGNPFAGVGFLAQYLMGR